MKNYEIHKAYGYDPFSFFYLFSAIIGTLALNANASVLIRQLCLMRNIGTFLEISVIKYINI